MTIRDLTIEEIIINYPRIGKAIKSTIQFAHHEHTKWTGMTHVKNELVLYLHADTAMFNFNGFEKLQRYINTIGVDCNRNLYLVLRTGGSKL